MLVAPPAAVVLILANQGLSSSLIDNASLKGKKGACSSTRFAMLPISELCVTKSATAPSDAIFANLPSGFLPLPINVTNLPLGFASPNALPNLPP